jgi:hypothetical protein
MKQVIIDCQTGEQTIVEVEDIVLPPKTEEELRQEYESLVVSFIREKYSESEELALHRKKFVGLDSNNEFEIYNTYAEECKTRARQQVYGGEV